MLVGATVQSKMEQDLMANSVLIPVVKKDMITFGAKLHQVISTKEKLSWLIMLEVKSTIKHYSYINIQFFLHA